MFGRLLHVTEEMTEPWTHDIASKERAACPLWQGRPMYTEHHCCRGLEAAQ